MIERKCKLCKKDYKATESTANNEWGFCSKVCENLYDVWEDRDERVS